MDDSRSPRLLTITRDITEQKKLEEQLLQLTITDGLTQISNRRNFFSVAAAEYERVLRHKRDLSIIIFDLDIFKDINDSFGHSAGDVALREIAQLCQDEIRSTDLVARYGGEEFAILLPETNLREAQDLAERLREKIARKTIKHGEKKIKVTISAGVAHLNHLIEISLEELIDQADKALYFSKQNGRNQVNVWEEITSKEK